MSSDKGPRVDRITITHTQIRRKRDFGRRSIWCCPTMELATILCEERASPCTNRSCT